MNGFRPPDFSACIALPCGPHFQGMLCLHNPLDAGGWRSCHPLYGWFPFAKRGPNFGPVCPKTGLPVTRHHRCVPLLGLIHDAMGGSSNGSESSPGPAGGVRLLVAATASSSLPRRFLAAFPLFGHYCSNRYLCVPVSIEIVWAAGNNIEKKKTDQAGQGQAPQA